MTVWIVNPFDNLPTEGRRPQRYWLMAAAFARAGHRVVYWTSDFSHATKEKRRSSAAAQADDAFEVVQIPTLPYPKNVCWARVRSHRQLARDFERMALERIAESSRRTGSQHPLSPSTSHLDLLIASTPPLGLCDAARRVAKRGGAKFVCDIQDAWPETFARLLPRGLKGLGAFLFAPLRRTARRLYREADLVTGVSARYRALSGRDDFYLAYHGIAVGETPERIRTAAAPAADRTRSRLVYLGNLGEGYDLETVIEAVAQRANLSLDIAGLGPKEPALRALVARRRLGERVRFQGYLDEKALGNLLARCDVGVIPMRDDSWVGLPYKLGDYLKAALPVVSSLHGECGDLLARTDFGRTYDFGDAASLLAALDALPHVAVSLPPELNAAEIYSRYVDFVNLRATASPREISSPHPTLKLSVIVPTLNGSIPQGLRDQVAACADAELVVVTGVSPVGKARNEGLRRAKGDWIAWVDADDEVTDDWLTEILAALSGGPDVVTLDAALVGWSHRSDCVWGVAPACATAGRLVTDVYRDLCRPSWLCLYVTRRELWRGLSFDEEVRIAEDYLLLPHVLLRATSCRYVPKKLYRYIRNDTSLMQTEPTECEAKAIGLWERRLVECPAAYRGACRWGLCVSAYWLCGRAARRPPFATAPSRENAARCRRIIVRSLPSLLWEALSSQSLALRDRILWMLRFVTAALDCWTLQRMLHGRASA